MDVRISGPGGEDNQDYGADRKDRFANELPAHRRLRQNVPLREIRNMRSLLKDLIFLFLLVHLDL